MGRYLILCVCGFFLVANLISLAVGFLKPWTIDARWFHFTGAVIWLVVLGEALRKPWDQ